MNLDPHDPLRALRHLVLPIVVAAAMTPVSVSAQALGDVARQEEARRKAVTTPGKVYTTGPSGSTPMPAQPTPGTADNPPSSGSATPPTAADVPKSGETPSAGPKAAEPSTSGPKDEAAWRKRIKDERDGLQRAQIFVDALQSRINALSADFTSRDDPAQRAVIAGDREKALAELDRVKQEIQKHTKAISDIQEEARRAGVPAGWVR